MRLATISDALAMANSKAPGPFGFVLPPVQLKLRPPRSPGTLGCNDAADPNCSALLGDTEGSLGIGDHAEPGKPRARLLNRKLAIRVANQFDGTPIEQAKTLLSQQKPHGHVIPPLMHLPQPLDTLIGMSVLILDRSFQAYLTKVDCKESEIGGPVSLPITKNYFVIHDTSSPEIKESTFPSNIDYPVYALKTPEWKFNLLADKRPGKGVHMYISRNGSSVTVTDFSQSRGMATQFEIAHDHKQRNFVDIEMVQPRLKDTHGKYTVGPAGGFTPQQVQRLALAYVAASVRRKIWLIPAYHKNVDPGHRDDPKNFDLDSWANDIQSILDQIEETAGDKG
jgi:hypothetical protein